MYLRVDRFSVVLGFNNKRLFVFLFFKIWGRDLLDIKLIFSLLCF